MQPQRLSDDEKKVILQRLVDLEACRKQVAKNDATIVSYEDFIKRLQEVEKIEKDAWTLRSENEKKAMELEKQQSLIYKDQATFYKAAYESAIKKPGGIGRALCKFFTLGIAACR